MFLGVDALPSDGCGPPPCNQPTSQQPDTPAGTQGVSEAVAADGDRERVAALQPDSCWATAIQGGPAWERRRWHGGKGQRRTACAVPQPYVGMFI